MPLSLRDAAFMDPPTSQWSARKAITTYTWPTLPGSGTKVRPFARRFAGAGGELRRLANGSKNCWTHIDRSRIVGGLRQQLRDPLVIDQSPTDFCGPLSFVSAWMRRNPKDVVRCARNLLENGSFTTVTGRVIAADKELRGLPVPSGGIGHLDWMLAATIRDDENINLDIDDGVGWEALTMPGAMESWTEDILGFNAGTTPCWHSGELNALLDAKAAVDDGGVAFILIDSCLIREGPGDDEEDMWFRRAAHHKGGKPDPLGSTHHSQDDGFPPDHWVMYLGDLRIGSDHDAPDSFGLRIWSWGREYVLKGSAEAIGEYVYETVYGRP